LYIGDVAECGGELGVNGCDGSSRALVPSGTLAPWSASAAASLIMSMKLTERPRPRRLWTDDNDDKEEEEEYNDESKALLPLE